MASVVVTTGRLYQFGFLGNDNIFDFGCRFCRFVRVRWESFGVVTALAINHFFFVIVLLILLIFTATGCSNAVLVFGLGDFLGFFLVAYFVRSGNFSLTDPALFGSWGGYIIG